MKAFYKSLSTSLIVSLAVTVFLVGCSSKSTTEPTSSATANAVAATAAPTAKPSVTPAPLAAVTIDFWHAYGEGEEKVLKEQILPAFAKLHPNIKVNAVRMPSENLDTQVLTASAGGAAPDVMRMDNTWIARFAKEGALQSLESFPEFQKIVIDSFKAPMDTNLYNGKYYGVPLDTNTKVAIYNKDLLQKAGAAEPPKTIDELVALAKKLKSQGKFFGMTIGGPDVWNFSPWFWTLGGKYTDDKYTTATGYINSPESIKALETIVSWNNDGLLAPPILGGQPGTWEGLRGDKGVAANYMMINDGPWFYGILGDAVKDKMIPAKMPAGPDGKSHSVIGGEDMVIFKGAKHPNEAWTFTQFMLSEDIQLVLTLKTGAVPTNMNAAKSDQLKTVYFLQPYLDELNTAYARTPSAKANEIGDVAGKAFESVLRKKSDAKTALDKAAKDIDALIASAK